MTNGISIFINYLPPGLTLQLARVHFQLTIMSYLR